MYLWRLGSRICRGKAPDRGSKGSEDTRIFQYGAKVRTPRPATVPLDMHDSGTGISPATTLAREYMKSQRGNVGVLLIPAAHGGTRFGAASGTLPWTVATRPPLNSIFLRGGGHTGPRGCRGSEGGRYRVALKGITWHQRESNAGMSTSEYSTHVDDLIGYFRTRLAEPELPFVVGSMAQEGTAATPGRMNVDRSHRQTPN
jgi:hypothetical protein